MRIELGARRLGLGLGSSPSEKARLARVVVFPVQLLGAVIVFSLFLGTIATVYGLLWVRGCPRDDPGQV